LMVLFGYVIMNVSSYIEVYPNVGRLCVSIMRKNKIVYILLIMSLFVNSVSAASGPSVWAVDEVEKAVQNRLVPETMQTNYQTDITRGEYVVLALKAFARDGNLVQILKPFPFTDIEGHQYEGEIVEAYNAGLINGYGDGTFKPDAKITRQEIASDCSVVVSKSLSFVTVTVPRLNLANTPSVVANRYTIIIACSLVAKPCGCIMSNPLLAFPTPLMIW